MVFQVATRTICGTTQLNLKLSANKLQDSYMAKYQGA